MITSGNSSPSLQYEWVCKFPLNHLLFKDASCSPQPTIAINDFSEINLKLFTQIDCVIEIFSWEVFSYKISANYQSLKICEIPYTPVWTR
jgi:hypothetical protein